MYNYSGRPGKQRTWMVLSQPAEKTMFWSRGCTRTAKTRLVWPSGAGITSWTRCSTLRVGWVCVRMGVCVRECVCMYVCVRACVCMYVSVRECVSA